MASIYQVTWRWQGTTGGTGYTNLYYQVTAGDGTEALAAVTKSRLLFDGAKALLPNLVQISLQTDVRVIEDTTGDLVNIWTVSGPAAVTGTAGASYFAAPVGGCVDWPTSTIHGKHMMTGRTFFVPLYSATFDTNGSLAIGTLNTLATAAENMRTASGPTFGVWGRPRAAKTVGGVTVPALSGLWAPALSSRIPDKAVVLRSRRD
jgi:hypothetical protein